MTRSSPASRHGASRPVILRCGIPTPQELTCAAVIQEVDGVAWLPLVGTGATTYLASTARSGSR